MNRQLIVNLLKMSKIWYKQFLHLVIRWISAQWLIDIDICMIWKKYVLILSLSAFYVCFYWLQSFTLTISEYPRKPISMILERNSDVLNCTYRKPIFKLLSCSWWSYLRTARWQLWAYDLQDGQTRKSLTIRSVILYPPRKSLSR